VKLLIISDSHGRTTYLDWVIEKEGPFDMVMHLGDLEGDEHYMNAVFDCPVYMVSGNNDYFSDVPRERLVNVGRHKIWMTHGHRYRVHMGLEMIKTAGREKGADIVMFGHIHRPLVEQGYNITVINPGSISQPRQDGHKPSYIIMEIDKKGEVSYSVRYVS